MSKWQMENLKVLQTSEILGKKIIKDALNKKLFSDASASMKQMHAIYKRGKKAEICECGEPELVLFHH